MFIAPLTNMLSWKLLNYILDCCNFEPECRVLGFYFSQVNGNLEREYRDCIKSRRDKIGITRHIMMHQVLYNVHVTLFIGQLHNIWHLMHHDMPCDPNLVSSAFYTIPFLNCTFFHLLVSSPLLLWFLSVTSLTISRILGLHYSVLLEMMMSVLQEVKGLTKIHYTSSRKTSFHAKFQAQCLHGLPVLT